MTQKRSFSAAINKSHSSQGSEISFPSPSAPFVENLVSASKLRKIHAKFGEMPSTDTKKGRDSKFTKNCGSLGRENVSCCIKKY